MHCVPSMCRKKQHLELVVCLEVAQWFQMAKNPPKISSSKVIPAKFK